MQVIIDILKGLFASLVVPLTIGVLQDLATSIMAAISKGGRVKIEVSDVMVR